MDLNSRSRDGPLLVQLAIYRRWDLLAIAIELGADLSGRRPDGRDVASELASQAEGETQGGREIPAALQQVRTTLAAPALKPRSRSPTTPAGN